MDLTKIFSDTNNGKMISSSSTMMRSFERSIYFFFLFRFPVNSIRMQCHVNVEIGDTIFLYTRKWMHIKISRRNIIEQRYSFGHFYSTEQVYL